MVRRRKPPRRPTGVIQTRQLQVGGGRVPQLGPVMSFKLPEEKNAAETVVMEKLASLSGCADFLPMISSFEKFPNDHGPDFIIQELVGPAYVELVEIAPLHGPYVSANHCMNVGKYIDHAISQVKIKIKKYGVRSEFRPIYLIIYVSHYGFSPDLQQTKALRRQMQCIRNDVFNNIYLVLFAHDGTPTAIIMWPFHAADITRNEVRQLRKAQMVRPDLSLARIISDASHGDYVDTTVRILLPRGTDMRPSKRMIQHTKVDG